MSPTPSSNPIGIFDSGIGGLTVAHALVSQLPHEDIIYFGDTAHLPYGDKSVAAIQNYSVAITEKLLSQNCKAIVIACHSASSAAFQCVKEYCGDRAQVINVIDPVIAHLGNHYEDKTIGLIATAATINTQTYQDKISALNQRITLKTQATPILAAAIEDGFHRTNIVDLILQEYFIKGHLHDINALILGCTHYPIIKNSISALYDHAIDIIDPSDIVADAVHARLKQDGLLNTQKTAGQHTFCISDYTELFAKHAKMFFGEEILLTHCDTTE